jgi:hypothetical protein
MVQWDPEKAQDDVMLAEYDFSKGVRGKHRDRHLAPQLPGVQFLKIRGVRKRMSCLTWLCIRSYGNRRSRVILTNPIFNI